MTVREYAKIKNFKIVGKLKRIKDKYYGVCNNHYSVYLDEAKNEYCVDKKAGCFCIVTFDGGIL